MKSTFRINNFVEKTRSVVGICLMLALIGVLILVAAYHPFTSSGPYRREYEGRVVEKWLAPSESRMGSSFSRILLIESREGERIKVVVSEVVYNQAEAGKWVRSSREGVIVSAEPAAAK